MHESLSQILGARAHRWDVAPLSRTLLSLVAIGLVFGTVSCGKGVENNVGSYSWFMREYRKAADNRARHQQTRDRDRRFHEWRYSPEGKRAIASRADTVFEADAGFPDTVYDMTPGGQTFTISSAAAGARLTGRWDHHDGFLLTRLYRPDGTSRQCVQGRQAEMLGDWGDESFDDDERLAAALLRSNPRPGWPGRSFRHTRRDEGAIAARMWEDMTGETLRFR